MVTTNNLNRFIDAPLEDLSVLALLRVNLTEGRGGVHLTYVNCESGTADTMRASAQIAIVVSILRYRRQLRGQLSLPSPRSPDPAPSGGAAAPTDLGDARRQERVPAAVAVERGF